MSGKKNIFINGFYSVTNLLLTMVLTIVIRKFFTMYLSVEFLGINSLYVNILGLLSLADMGVASIISYNLYKELAYNNLHQINKLMSIYQKMYMVIGFLVFVLGLIVFFCLPAIIREKKISWVYINIVYMIQLGSTVGSYFLSYRRMLFIADKKEFVCIKIDTFFLIVKNILQLVSIIKFKNFILYSLIALFTNVFANIAIYIKCGKTYEYLEKTVVTKDDIKALHIFKDIKYLLLGKIGGLIYYNTDNIIITFFLGLNMTGIVANYSMISTSVNNLITATMKGITPMVGNLIYRENKERIFTLYNTLDLFYIIIGAIVACGYLNGLQALISLFFGSNFILPFGYVICLAINAYIGLQFQAACDFRNTYGQFDNDAKYFLLSAIANLIFSIVFIKFFGIIGVIIGTIIGVIFILYSRVQFVFRIILHKPLHNYLIKHLMYSLITSVELFFVCKICSFILVTGWFVFALRLVLSIILISVLQLINCLPSRDFRNLILLIVAQSEGIKT